MTESEITQNRIIDLSRRSYERGIYTYTDFLTLAEQSDFANVLQSGKLYSSGYEVFGGIDGAERVMIRFGSVDEFGYEESWPIKCIKVTPLNKKFAENLSHRDVLGSLMNLGIERSLLGDIILKTSQECISDGGNAHEKYVIYILAREHIAETICSELTRIRHTSVMARVIDEIDESVAPTLKEVNLQVKSERIDLVISHIYNLSRSQAAEFFLGKKVFINGRLMENESHTLKPDDIVSLRGQGRFIYKGVTGTTKKGNYNILILKYI